MDNQVPQKKEVQGAIIDANTIPPQRGEPATIGGQPAPHLEAGGNTLEGLREANATPHPTHFSDTQKNTLIKDLHKKDLSISTLRTLETDASEAIKKQNISIVSIAAQKIKQRDELASSTVEKKTSTIKWSNIFKKISFVTATLFFIAVGITAVGYAILNVVKQTPLPTRPQISSNTFINADATKIVTTSSDQNTLSAWLSARKSLTNETATIVQVIITPTGTTTPLNSQEFLSNLGAAHIPSWFIRSIGNLYMTGFYHDTSNWDPFLILRVNSYTNAFAGMLQWETNMGTDLAPLYTKKNSVQPRSIEQTTSTASTSNTTPTASSTVITLSPPATFSDIFIDNKNVRALAVPGQKPFLLYSFPEQNVLVITTSDAAMNEIFNRLISHQFIH